MNADHDDLGRVLKCHLVLEHYLDRFLSQQIPTIEEARLSFVQKARLLPTARSAAAFVRPGIIQLNAIRNRFAHSLMGHINNLELGPISVILEAARPGLAFQSPVDAIEAFTTVACTFLIVPPPDLQAVFMEAFSELKVRDNSEDAA
jgi:hypothetical protein